jgi:hypothetical protein
MADLDAELHELPDNAKEYMQGFYRGRDEGLAIGQAEGEVMERERIISLIVNSWTEYPDVDALISLITGDTN